MEKLEKLSRGHPHYLRYICCRVDSSLTVKVTDTALSRDVFPNDYHCLGDNENRPVKWLALEALLDRHFSPASDVVCTYLLCVSATDDENINLL